MLSTYPLNPVSLSIDIKICIDRVNINSSKLGQNFKFGEDEH